MKKLLDFLPIVAQSSTHNCLSLANLETLFALFSKQICTKFVIKDIVCYENWSEIHEKMIKM